MKAKLEINDLFVELKNENKRLLNELLFAQKLIKLFESYRNYLNVFHNNCNCDQNIENIRLAHKSLPLFKLYY